jgi:hypothetical protein
MQTLRFDLTTPKRSNNSTEAVLIDTAPVCVLCGKGPKEDRDMTVGRSCADIVLPQAARRRKNR